ncbi:MAG: helix-turn-helix transcriptional regulator [Eubacteriales bacterium]
MIYAYKQECISEVMDNLGCMLDYAVYSMGFEANRFLNMFIISGLAQEIEHANPKYTVGMSGIELAHEVLYITFGTEIEVKQYYTLDKSPEYWGMWSLAYYQFESELSFGRLLEYVTFDIALQLYPTLHEADISKFVDVLDTRIELYRKNTETTVARLRRMQGYSQKVLAEQSGVSLRMIQLYEQRQNDINKAQAETLLKLAKALHCSMEELMV